MVKLILNQMIKWRRVVWDEEDISYFLIALFKKKKLLPPPINEKTNRFRNTKFGIQIAFSMKMCKMPSSKIKDQWGPRWGPP